MFRGHVIIVIPQIQMERIKAGQIPTIMNAKPCVTPMMIKITALANTANHKKPYTNDKNYITEIRVHPITERTQLTCDL